MNRKELISKYIKFFKSKDHKQIKNSSLVPENDPTTLFIGSGMETIVPFLLGESHPQGRRLMNIQRCIRTGDIEEVGDTYHHTFFEMFGNWSLGDYGKKEAIEFTFEFLTKQLNIPQERLAATCFVGNKDIPKDEESYQVYVELGFPKERIAFLDKDNLWGPAGSTGPCGPNTEIFYWKLDDTPTPKVYDPQDDNWLEIGNNVIMTYNKDSNKKFMPLGQKNIDFGGGIERTLTTLNNLEDNYLLDCWKPLLEKIEELSGKKYEDHQREMRIIADHIKAAVFIINDGVVPGNAEQGYVLRRLIRRAVRYSKLLGIPQEADLTTPIVKEVLRIYDDYDLDKNRIINELNKEEDAFEKTLEQGLSQLEKIFKNKKPIPSEKFTKLMENPKKGLLIGETFENKNNNKAYAIKDLEISEEEINAASINGKETFLLFQSYGFPLEITDELAMSRGFLVDHQEFRAELSKHQELSRTASAGKFKSGLADNSDATKKLHTATHLLNEALAIVLDKPDLHQRGSNITPERLRFDFNFDRKLTPEELREVEDLVNLKIKANLPVTCELKSVEEAKTEGAKGIFDNKYGEEIKVYSIGAIGEEFTKEICAGPHVENTSELGHFKIKKESSSSAGVRRIKAILE